MQASTLYTDNPTNEIQSKINYRLSMKIKNRTIDPRCDTKTVYAICTQKEIDKLIDFDSDYVTYSRYIRNITVPQNKLPINSVIYDIEYNEKVGYEGWFSPHITFRILRYNGDLTRHIQDILIAEDDLEFANERLRYANVTF